MKQKIGYFLILFLFLAPGMAKAEPNLIPAQQTDTPSTKPFDFSIVEKIARQQATQPYSENSEAGVLPESLAGLDNDQYHNIRYNPKQTLWRGQDLPFQLQFFPRGFLFKDQVTIHIIEKGIPHTVTYSNSLFDFGNHSFSEPLPPDLGFAGFRIFYPLRKDKELNEIAAFLGASYFRAIGLGQVYGLSARGLAVDTGLTKTEEFPLFKEFWIQKPNKQSSELTVYALLDSPGMTGAYQFIIRPGITTTLEVTSHLFFRHGVERLGMAPLTSMFFHGENTDYFVDDVRPEVHDSDGLLIGKGNGEWVWRPLTNPRRLQVSVFSDTDPIGFGLMQRDRHFGHYQDLENKYQLRPSAWVESVGQWGEGAIYLIEIPSDAEQNDNIAAFWVPQQPIREAEDWVFKYRLHFLANNSPEPAGGGKALTTRIGSGGAEVLNGKRRKFVVDFASETLRLISKHAPVEADISTSQGRIMHPVVHKNPFTNHWRLSFELESEASEKPIDLRAYLKVGEETLSETWIYQWSKP
ncbi:glucan biosynthesis protein G [Nitrosococcus watsonii]|uniref:Glucans biosynthesis protein G n=1 Tax=Nitrosococcus watsoni (strain C-113) TaxID=105559 RepID=D8KA29_NITWC|nr:glucan biosynthesis protein G [Nitrosococcus watsonii]ADJ29387.1 periplasmic glucan biosynthesis protein MdoG [Nitrosococcus watsonii C-113]